jgi:hypothetical protein
MTVHDAPGDSGGMPMGGLCLLMLPLIPFYACKALVRAVTRKAR